MKRESAGKKSLLFLMFFAVILLLSSRTVEAAPKKYRVIFADAKGKVSSERFRRWSCTEEKNTCITLPEVSASGYRYYWVLKKIRKKNFTIRGIAFG